MKDSWLPGMATGWGPYFDAMFPPARVTAWINFKRMSTGVNIARRLWDRREELRQEYCDICWRLRSDDLPARHQLTESHDAHSDSPNFQPE